MKAVLAIALVAAPAGATDLYRPDSFSTLAGDRIARNVGDLVTILVYENASAANTATTSSAKRTKLDGAVSAGHSFDERAALGITGNSDNQGATARSGRMVAQISATVDEVLPNGDLHLIGAQEIAIGGERTHIRVAGRVRPFDLTSANTVLSSRLADARIDYDGRGFVSRGARPGIVSRVFSWLGLL